MVCRYKNGTSRAAWTGMILGMLVCVILIVIGMLILPVLFLDGYLDIKLISGAGIVLQSLALVTGSVIASKISSGFGPVHACVFIGLYLLGTACMGMLFFGVDLNKLLHSVISGIISCVLSVLILFKIKTTTKRIGKIRRG